jgi:hypothetical protein
MRFAYALVEATMARKNLPNALDKCSLCIFILAAEYLMIARAGAGIVA